MAVVARLIYVISDLHLGGEAQPGKRGFRICTHEAELAGFINSLTKMDGPAIELVLNGDVIDFLAEPIAGNPPRWSAFHYPETIAVKCMDDVATRSATSVVFTALKGFLGKGHRLVILPGNHDSELNLPAVRRSLRGHVGADRGADYEFIAHGEAYRVGDVLIEHGDRMDDMNFVDYHMLRRLCGIVSRGKAVREEFLFDPPAGSKLVAEVINDIKKTYSFVDLLKPEVEAAFPVILALEPGRRRQLLKIAQALAEGKVRRKQQLRRYDSNISARADPPVPVEAGGSVCDELEEILVRTVGRADFAMPGGEAGTTRTVQEISLLDLGRGLASLLLGNRDDSWEQRLHDLFDAMRAFQNVDAFDRSVETNTAYLNEARNLAYGPIRHVVFGHTHLAKQVPLAGGGFYFNSGTWADVMELPRDILDTTRRFAPLAELEELMRDLVANDFSRHIVFRPTYVRIEQDLAGHSVGQQLLDYSGVSAK